MGRKKEKKKKNRKRGKKETKLESRKGWLNSVPSASFNPFVLDVWMEYESRKRREREGEGERKCLADDGIGRVVVGEVFDLERGRSWVKEKLRSTFQ